MAKIARQNLSKILESKPWVVEKFRRLIAKTSLYSFLLFSHCLVFGILLVYAEANHEVYIKCGKYYYTTM